MLPREAFVGPAITPEGIPPTDPRLLYNDGLSLDPSTYPGSQGVHTFPDASIFLRQLPARLLTYWHRVGSLVGTSAFTTTIRRTVTIDQLPDNTGLIILSVIQRWYDDEGASDILLPRGDTVDAYGRVAFDLLVNGAPVWNAIENLIDPNGGANTARRVSGFTALNTNLLLAGPHSTALYVRAGALVEASWLQQAAVADTPEVVAADCNGYLVPVREFDDFLLRNRYI